MADFRTPRIASPSLLLMPNNSKTVFNYPSGAGIGLSVAHAFSRCFSPTLVDVKSPALSPIPDLCLYEHKETTPTEIPEFKEPKGKPRFRNSLNQSQINLLILDKTLEMETVLASAGLGKYVKIFEDHGIDLPKLLKMDREDLIKLGIYNEEDRNTLTDLLHDLNSSK